MSKITVSIFMLTYNQEAYISQAIEGVLMQKTNFKYQLVIGEDCSTDKTRSICEAYQQHYPEKIKLLPQQDKNMGLIANYMRTIKACDGKYIAICDGDDYWVDEYKLQKQVDVLEQNKDCSIVFSKVYKWYPDGNVIKAIPLSEKQITGFNNLVYGNFIPSVTALFKNEQQRESLPEWIINFPYGDWPTYLWTIKDQGKIYLLNEYTAVYRMDIGASAKLRRKNSVIVRVNIAILNAMLNDEKFKSRISEIKDSIMKHQKQLMLSLNREKAYLEALKIYLTVIFKLNNRLKFTKLYLYSIKNSF
ncbi:glycosyltransferase [Aestuariibaculum sediminum]|uniref:Glycosyltransferase n=1 Tax=Aestuariibaculum sediminum TaxID=2770637 RepID=A0A8J6QBQ4_9FLAO|nr:glycosyltransferase [Aestuariibaculum sediminum]MBD0833091.1 glycosyltransferase [Aestuariibaculum sediminum]